MSNKLPKMTPEQRQQRDNELYMQGRPTRLEVANYVNSLLENQYSPQIHGAMTLGFMVLQAILIDKGICTGQEIEDLTKQFIQQRQQEKEAENAQDKSETEESQK